MATTGTKLTIESTSPAGASSTLNVGYINPSATDIRLKEFAEKLFAFSENTIKGIYRVDTESLSGTNYEYSSTGVSPSTITLTSESPTAIQVSTNIPTTVTPNWVVSYANRNLDLTNGVFSRVGETGNFSSTIMCYADSGTEAATTATIQPFVNGNPIANAVTIDINVNIA